MGLLVKDFSRNHVALAATLAAVAGYVDAVGFIELNGLFVSFMSGNSTRLSTYVALGHWYIASRVAGLIVLFIIGSGLGALIAHFGGPTRQRRVLFIEAALLAIAAICHGTVFSFVSIPAMVLAMGVENAVFFKEGDTSVGLTYMTGAVVKVGQRLALALVGGARWGWVSHLLLWLSLCSGAITGTLVYGWLGMSCLWFPSLGALLLGCVIVRPRFQFA